MEERRGKPGWVSAFPTSFDEEATVHIPLQNITDLRAHGFGFILKIEFLMTYFNAGVVDVLLCGKSMGTVDSLWSDRKLRMSVSKSAFFTVCNKWCSSTENVTFDIVHRRWNDTSGVDGSGLSTRSGSPTGLDHGRRGRGNQKFKILSMSLCGHIDICHHCESNLMVLLGD